MFTIEQIALANSKINSGSLFPNSIPEIKKPGVIAFETWVLDSHTDYYGANGFQTRSMPNYQNLTIADSSDKVKFLNYLKIHQQGETDYLAFCNHFAETGIEKWFVDLDRMTCTYYNKAGIELLVEIVPTV